MSRRGVSMMAGASMLAAALVLEVAQPGSVASADSTSAAVTGAAATGAGAKTAGLSGTWRLDRKKSTMPDRERSGGPRMGGGPMGGGPGGWGGGRRGGPGEGMRGGRGGPGGGGGGFFGRLPDLISVDEGHGLLTVNDSTGKALQQIATFPGDSVPAEKKGVRRIGGRREGNRVEIERPAPMGGTIFETWALRSDDVLEIRVKIQPEAGGRGGDARGDMPPREFVRVYNREAGQ